MKFFTFTRIVSFIFFFLIVMPLLLNYVGSLFNLSCPVINFVNRRFGTVLIFFGAVIIAYCARLFFIFGKGTPVPTDPPKKLVVAGLYKYSRNPMYIGMYLVILGELFLSGSFLILTYLLFIAIVFHFYVVKVEEPKLKKRFGKQYEEYLKRVPRWIIW